MEPVELIGLVAGALTTIAFVPQAAKTWRSGSARDFAWSWLLLFNAGVLLWLLYGALIGSPGLLAANAVTCVLALSILWVKFRRG